MIIHHKRYFPSFGLGGSDQSAVCLYTVLSINEEVRDCAAYQGVSFANVDDAMIDRIRAGGDKIREAEARNLFPEIENMKLRYRK